MRNRTVLPLGIQENFKISSQFTPAKLTPQEQFSLGGMDTVRGYPPDDYYADNAVLMNIELLFPAVFIPEKWRFPYAEKSFRDSVTPVAFLDYGYGTRRGANEKPDSLLGAGAGVRLDLYGQGVLRMEWAYPLGDMPESEGKASRFHISVDIQEKLPEEIARIRKLAAEEDIKRLAWLLVNEEMGRFDSPLRNKILTELYLAQKYYKDGDLEAAKKFYEDISKITKMLYRQAEEYVRACVEHERTLKERCDMAVATYKEGRIEEAKDMWKKIAEEAKFKPLTLTF
jgi:tetratricopeptide (TPR) repeat protein